MTSLMSNLNLRRLAAASLTALCSFAIHPSAQACGGLFCSGANPVNQTAERIVFAKNDNDTITAVIEVMYEGPAHEFAWVLPVPAGDVEVGVGSTAALDQLQAMTNPRFNLQVQFDDCGNSGIGGSSSGPFPAGGMASGGSTAAAGGAGSSDVDVVASGSVGPYDYAQLSVGEDAEDPAATVVSWLEMNEYDVTGIGEDLLSGYLEDGMNLLAFKLSKGNDAGAVRPVLLTYPGKKPMIPIQPTAVAANDDMGVMVWVLGEARAAPINYRHLEINEAYINWFNPAANYDDVINVAADEAGGQGFVTEQSGPSAPFRNAFFQDFRLDAWNSLRNGQFDTVPEFIQYAVELYGTSEGFLDAMSENGVLPLREGATPTQFLNCPECYFATDVEVRTEAYPSTPYDAATDPMNEFDALKALGGIERLVIEPDRRMDELFSAASWVTRFYTTLSPHEMTKDPIFSFNENLPELSNLRTAVQRIHCEGDWHVDLPQGGSVTGEGRQWPFVPGEEDGMPTNIRILQLSESSQKLVTDSTKEVLEFLAERSGEEPAEPTKPSIDATPWTFGEEDPGKPNIDPEPGPGSSEPSKESADAANAGGCSLSSGPAPRTAWLGLLALGLLLPVRRRIAGKRGDASLCWSSWTDTSLENRKSTYCRGQRSATF